eukprot:364250-Chlamydomonas_euryale.AAC.4
MYHAWYTVPALVIVVRPWEPGDDANQADPVALPPPPHVHDCLMSLPLRLEDGRELNQIHQHSISAIER